MSFESPSRARRLAARSFWFVLLALGALALAAPSAVFAQDGASPNGAISGSVASDAGVPIPSARIVLVELRRSTLSDGSGAFQFDSVPAGTYRLQIDRSGSGTASRTIEVSAGQTLDVEVRVGLFEHSDEIVVTAAPLSRSSLELAQPVDVLTGEELLFRRQARLGDILDGLPGISTTFFGAGASRPVIRGLSADRVRVLQSGLGTGDVASLSVDHAVSAEPAAAEAIEILRGPSTLLYGSSAAGGVVNIVDGRIPTLRAESGVSGIVDLSLGTVADQRAGTVRLDGGSGDWAWHLDATILEQDDYDIPDEAEVDPEPDEEPITGALPNSDVESDSFGAGLTYFIGDRALIGVSVSGFNTEYGIPGGGHGHEEGEEHGDEEEHEGEEHEDEDEDHDHEEGEEEDEFVRIDLERERVDLRAEIFGGLGAFEGLEFRLGVVDYEHVEIEFEGDEPEVGTRFFNDSWEARAQVIQRERNGWTGSFGLQLEQEEVEAIGEEAFIPPSEADTLGLFTFQELKRGPVRWQFGARWETSDVDAEASPDRSFDGISASVGAVWDFADDWQLAASLSRSTKLPNAEELFANGAHVAVQTFEIGDPDLDEEVSNSLDLTLRRTADRWSGSLTAFTNRFDDYIFRNFTGEEEDGFPVIVYSQADADFWGFEFETRFELWRADDRHFDLELRGDLVRAEFDAGGDLPQIPPQRLGLGVHYHVPRWHFYAEAMEVDEQDRVAENETPTDGYTMVNAGVSYRWLFGGQVIDILVRGRNLLDEDARNHVSFLKDTVPLPGRDVGLSVRFSF
ncbi:MAG: TonB-dependent receptor [Acidobacteriota bacterium]